MRATGGGQTALRVPGPRDAEHHLAGATVYRGILGDGAHRRVHKEKPLNLSHDSSVMLSVVDTEEKLKAFLPIVDKMVSEGLVVLSDVDIVKYSHRAHELRKQG